MRLFKRIVHAQRFDFAGDKRTFANKDVVTIHTSYRVRRMIINVISRRYFYRD